jgi:hypothetical protein
MGLPMTAQTTDLTQDLIDALRTALPYVERIAATAPTEMNRQRRQQEAARDARVIREILAKADA